MEYVFVIVGLVVFRLAALILTATVKGNRNGPLKVGRDTVAYSDRPRAEKQQMTQPQEEFVNDSTPPSHTRVG